jgi:hypothetical protein
MLWSGLLVYYSIHVQLLFFFTLLYTGNIYTICFVLIGHFRVSYEQTRWLTTKQGATDAVNENIRRTTTYTSEQEKNLTKHL